MEHIAISAHPRQIATKGERKRLRREGHIPAAIFGRGMEPLLVSVHARELARVLASPSGVNTLIDLSVENGRHLVRLTEVEMDPIQRTFLHVGLHKIVANEASKATVPVELIGEPEAVRRNEGLLETGATSIDVRSLPESLPSSIPIDVSDMAIGDVRYASDLKLPGGVELLSSPEAPIVSLHTLPTVDLGETLDAATADEDALAGSGTASAAGSASAG